MAYLLTVLVVLACLLLLWSAIPAVSYFVYAMLARFALVLLGLVWLVMALVGWSRYRAYKPSLIAPVVVLSTATLMVFSAPFWLGFQLSKGALEEAAGACETTTAASRVGVYDVHRIRSVDEGCRIYTTGGLMESVGIARLPHGPLLDAETYANQSQIQYWHVAGDWYGFSEWF